MTTTDRVRIDVKNGIASVRLARPEKLNALDPAMLQAIKQAGRDLAADRSLRAIVLSGEGRAFCAGLDFTSFAAMGEASANGEDTGGQAGGQEAGQDRGKDAGQDRGKGARETGGRRTRPMLARDEGSPANLAQEAGWVWHSMPVPVLAAVHGVAFGGGLQIALGADFRYVHPEARLSVMEIKWGLVPDMSGTQTLRHLVRLDVAKELTFTGRVVDGVEAAALGLATRVCDDPVAEATAMAEAIARRSPDAIRAGKALWNRAVEVDAAEGLQLEEQSQLSLIGQPNNREAIVAALEKREPRFVDPG